MLWEKRPQRILRTGKRRFQSRFVENRTGDPVVSMKERRDGKGDYRIRGRGIRTTIL